MARIGLTGTVSVGKTTLAKALGELDQFKEDKLLIEKNLTDSKETVNELNLKLNELEQLKQGSNSSIESLNAKNFELISKLDEKDK